MSTNIINDPVPNLEGNILNGSNMEGETPQILNYLTWVDYLVFILMLVMSSAIGIFFGCFGSKMKTTSDYLVGGRSMGMFPVIMSLIASFMSAIGLLGVPSDIYRNGVTFSTGIPSFFLVMPIVAFLYLPVFWHLQLTSANEYLEIRFNRVVRLLGSVFFLMQMSFYMAIAVYAPSLALAQMTGLPVRLSISLICFVCIFYTTIGGIKAVMWTDVLQALFMYGAMLFINIKGTMEQGGFVKVINTNLSNGRPGFFDFDFDPRTRYTFWNLYLGRLTVWTAIYGVNQTQVQRYMSLSSKNSVIKALMINGLGLVIMGCNSCYAGMVLYSKYENCDPIASKLITKSDQILPYYVMQNFGHIIGLPGLFIAAVFAGALSTISSGINSLAAIALEDFVKPHCFKNMSEKRATLMTKGLNFYFGIQTFALTYAAEQLGDVLSASLSIFGLFGGPILGLFTLGMFVPFANSYGAIVSSFVTLISVGWITFGRHVSLANGFIVPDKLPTNVCPNATTTLSIASNFNVTTLTELLPEDGDVEDLNILKEIYQISYMWYSFMGFVIFMTSGMLVSACTGGRNLKTLDPKLLSPFVRWFKCLYPRYQTIGAHLPGSEKSDQIPSSLRGEVNPAFEDSKQVRPSRSGQVAYGRRKTSKDEQTKM